MVGYAKGLTPIEHPLKGDKALGSIFEGLKRLDVESATFTVLVDLENSKSELQAMSSIVDAGGELTSDERRAAVGVLAIYEGFQDVAARGIRSSLKRVPSEVKVIMAEVEINALLRHMTARHVVLCEAAFDAIELA